MDPDQFQQLLTAFNESNRALVSQVTAAIARIPAPQPAQPASAQQVTSNHLTLLSNFEAFDPAKEKFVQYHSRFENYLQLKKVFDDKAVCAQLLLNCIGPSSYELLCSLAAPKNVSDLTYKELTTLLQNHYPKSNELSEQHKFLSRIQSPTESISDYVAALRKFISTCGFACSSCNASVADLFLRAQFIRGIKDSSIRAELLQIKDLTFPQAAEKALALEVSKIDSLAISNSTPVQSNATPPSQNINRVSTHQSHSAHRNPPSAQSRNTLKSQPHNKNQHRQQSTSRRNKVDYASLGLDGLCLRCGRNNHTTKECKISHSKLHCNSCQKDGHIEKVCITTLTKKPRHSVKAIDDEYPASQTFGIGKIDICDIFDLDATDTEKFVTTLLIEGKPQTFEVDSGAARTLLPKYLFDQLELAHTKLQAPDIRFRSYTGDIFDPIGFAEVKVEYNTRTSTEKLYVVSNNFSPVVGRVWIRRLQITLAHSESSRTLSNEIKLVQSDPEQLIQRMEHKFGKIFEQSVGSLPQHKGSLQLRPNAKPSYVKPRTLPFALRKTVETDLLKLADEGILTKIDHSDWASPLVVVPKPDGSLRLCVDYKTTVNPQLRDSHHPIPRIDETLHKLRGARFFCKLDLFKAYWHIPMDEESAMIQTISTHLGTFRINRLSQGIKTAPSIFHCILDQLLAPLTGVTAYFDDIIVFGNTIDECYHRLDSCLQVLQNNNLHLNRTKCVFFSQKITYLGYVIEHNKISKSPTKVSSILEAPRPKNIEDVRRFLGLVTYYSKFIPNASSITYPIRQLLLKNCKFFWSAKCESAFLRLKREIASDQVLTPYHPELPLRLACDASPYGIAAVLSHVINGDERPIAFISRSLTQAESQYSQLDREALAIVFAVGKFFQYLYGRHFELLTDNRPLIRIFHPSNVPPMTAGRLLRYAVFLRGFEYTIRHRSAEAHKNVDYLSRAPLPVSHNGIDVTLSKEADQIEIETICQISSLDITSHSLAQESATDAEIQPIITQLKNGTNDTRYSLNKGVLFRDDRVYIPTSLRTSILNELHSTHSGIVRMKRLARRYCYWPGIDSDIEKLVRSCSACAANQKQPSRIDTHTWEVPVSNFERVHMDYAGPVHGYNIFILIDAKSKWPEVRLTHSAPTSASTIEFLQDIFATHGFPAQLVSDNAAIFTSAEFSAYCRKCGIAQHFIAPGHPATNGQAERFVQTLKHTLKSCLDSSNAPLPILVRNILFRYRATPLNSGKSPAELYLHRPLRIQLDALRPLQKSPNSNKSPVKRHFIVGERVQARLGNKWELGKITACLGSLHYKVQLDSGFCTKKHVNQLVRSSVPVTPSRTPVLNQQPLPTSKRVTFDIMEPDLAQDNFLPAAPAANPVPAHIPVEAPIPNPVPVPVPEAQPLRRSTRQHRPPNRLDL